jgi:hypothetical protein
MSKLNLFYDQIEEGQTKENFASLIRYFRESKALSLLQFRHIELSFPANVTNSKVPHGLGFVPKDVIQTSLKGSGALSWNYGEFDATNLDITVTGATETDPVIVRAFIGTHTEDAL